MSDILVQLVDSSSGDEIRRKACETDFALFCRTYLPHYFTAEPAEYQREVLEIISRREITAKNEQVLKPLIKSEYHALFKSGKIGGLVDAEPRGFGKSVRLSFAYPLWCLLYRKEVFILVIGASQEAAENQLESIRRELEENELIIDDFGLMQTDKMWSKKKLILANGCAITAKGAGSALRGARYRERRPDLVICDDILKDEAAASQTQRDKIYSWVKRVLFPLGRDLFLIFVNTIFHSDDLVCRLFSEIEDGSLRDFAGLRFSCLTPSGKSLWPAYWPIDALEKKREELGSRHFNTEYMNEPSTDEEALANYDKYAQKALELMLRKNHDYDEAWRAMRVSSYTDLILMKIYRTKQIEGNGGKTLVSEGIDANYMDMINYSVFGLIKLEFGDDNDTAGVQQ